LDDNISQLDICPSFLFLVAALDFPNINNQYLPDAALERSPQDQALGNYASLKLLGQIITMFGNIQILTLDYSNGDNWLGYKIARGECVGSSFLLAEIVIDISKKGEKLREWH
jgi:hypothetical protein